MTTPPDYTHGDCARASHAPLPPSHPPRTPRDPTAVNMQDVNGKSVLRISDRKTIQLIEEYKKEECLWNTYLDDYPNRPRRMAAAEKIAKILNIPHFEKQHVLIKFKNLRNSYCQELKKIAHAEENGGAYFPKVQWFKLIDSFIRPHLQTSRSSTLKEVAGSDEITLESIKTDSETDEHLDWYNSYTVPMENVTLEEYTSDQDDVSNTSQPKKPKIDNSQPYYEDEVFELSNDSVIKVPTPSTSQHNDCFDDFGKYIASLLRTLPTRKAMTVQPKIVHLIVEEARFKEED